MNKFTKLLQNIQHRFSLAIHTARQILVDSDDVPDVDPSLLYPYTMHEPSFHKIRNLTKTENLVIPRFKAKQNYE